MMKYLITKFLLFYKHFISPIIGLIFGGACRFTPTCSEYSLLAIEKYGLIKGTILSLKRISKCHPFAKSGYDPVI